MEEGNTDRRDEEVRKVEAIPLLEVRVRSSAELLSPRPQEQGSIHSPQHKKEGSHAARVSMKSLQRGPPHLPRILQKGRLPLAMADGRLPLLMAEGHLPLLMAEGHMPLMITEGCLPLAMAAPKDSRENMSKGGARIMWVHLQASICTEWEQSMVMRSGANPEPPPEEQNLPALNGPAAAGDSPTAAQKPAGYKRPRTIHRCILKTSTSLQEAVHSGLECHVCNSRYSCYQDYWAHLINTTCAKAQKERTGNTAMDTIYSFNVKSGVGLPRSTNNLMTQVAPVQPRECPTGIPTLPSGISVQGLNDNYLQPATVGQAQEPTGVHKSPTYELLVKLMERKKTEDQHLRSRTGPINNPIKSLKRARNRNKGLEHQTGDQDIQIISEKLTLSNDKIQFKKMKFETNGSTSVEASHSTLPSSHATSSTTHATSPTITLATSILTASPPIQATSPQSSTTTTQSYTTNTQSPSTLSTGLENMKPLKGKESLLMLAKNQLTINQPINAISSADGEENANQAKSPPIVNISDDDQENTESPFVKTMLSQKTYGKHSSQADAQLENEGYDHLISTWCPCVASRSMPPITLQENAVDVGLERNLEKNLSVLLVSLLGEKRLRSLGYPKLEMTQILERILKLSNIKVTKEDDLCTTQCKRESRPGMQRVFRGSRYRVNALQRNILSLLQICVPDAAMWNLFGWKDLHVKEILETIAELGLDRTFTIDNNTN